MSDILRYRPPTDQIMYTDVSNKFMNPIWSIFFTEIAKKISGYFSYQVSAPAFKVDAMQTAPANASDTGTTGEIRITATHIYVCTATNTWKRVAIATWP